MISRFPPGAIVGAIAFYARVDRTATVTAEIQSIAVRKDAAALDLMERDNPTVMAHGGRNFQVVSRKTAMLSQLIVVFDGDVRMILRQC